MKMNSHTESKSNTVISGRNYIQNNQSSHQQHQQQRDVNYASPASSSIMSTGTSSSILSGSHQNQRSGRRSSHTKKIPQKFTIINNNSHGKLQVGDMTPNNATLLPPPSIMQKSNYFKNSNTGTSISYQSPESFANNLAISSASSPPSSLVFGNNNNSTGASINLSSKSNSADPTVHEEKNWWPHQSSNLPKPRKPSKCPLFCVFYAEFDIIVGSKISFQCPRQFMDNDICISTADIHRCLSQEFESRTSFSISQQQKQQQQQQQATVKATTEQQSTSLINNVHVDVLEKNVADNQRKQKQPEPYVGKNSMSIFDSTSDYIITGSELTDQIVSLSTHNMHILSRPTIINNASRYERNSFLFSAGFVIRRVEDPMPFRPLLSKLASTLRAMEVESKFLSDSKKRGQIQSVLQGILFSLNSKSRECNLILDDANSIHLKLFKPPKPISYPVLDHVVPVLLRPEWQLQMFDWDLTINWIVKYIDGLKYTSLISESSEVDLEMVRACLRVLKHHGVLTFVDIFRYSNFYESTSLASSMLAGNQTKLLQAAFESISKGSHNSHHISTSSLSNNPIIESCVPQTSSYLGTTPPTLSQHLLDISNHRYFVPTSTASQGQQQQKHPLDISSSRRKQTFANSHFLPQVQTHNGNQQHHHQQLLGTRNVSSEFIARSVSPSSSTFVDHKQNLLQTSYPQHQPSNPDTSNSNNPSSTNNSQLNNSPLPSSFPPTQAVHSNISNKVDNSSNHNRKYNTTSSSFSSKEGNRPSSFKCLSNSTSSFENNFKREENRNMLKMALAQMFCGCHRNATFGNILLSKVTETMQTPSHIPNGSTIHNTSKPNIKDKKFEDWENSSKGDDEFVKKSECGEISYSHTLKHDCARKLKENLHNQNNIDWKSVFEYFDHRRFISFGIIHGLIKRVHEYPWAFDKNINHKRNTYEIEKKMQKDDQRIKLKMKKANLYESTNQNNDCLTKLSPTKLRKLALKVAHSMDGTKCDDELCCKFHQPLDTLKEIVRKYANKSIVSLYSTSKYS